MNCPVSEQWIKKMEEYGICHLDNQQITRLRQHLHDLIMDELFEEDQDKEWVESRRRLYNEYENTLYRL